ncbi:hypothetical protein NIES208_02025 [[Limnothrix rosea] IAM M-220]|nr:hypothetical protein NIES208_02025 [[Limnothrix rosea] IAM M-220]
MNGNLYSLAMFYQNILRKILKRKILRKPNIFSFLLKMRLDIFCNQSFFNKGYDKTPLVFSKVKGKKD